MINYTDEEQKINKSLQDEEKTELTKIALDYYDEKNILPKKPRELTEKQKVLVKELKQKLGLENE